MNLTALRLNFRFCLNDLKVTTTVSEILMHRVAINHMNMAFKKIFRIVVWDIILIHPAFMYMHISITYLM